VQPIRLFLLLALAAMLLLGASAMPADASDDTQALAVASELVKDAGLEPVVVGPLSSARLFDVGLPVYVQVLTAKELRARLGL
jgi:predicted dinucleotide-binding enzyme